MRIAVIGGGISGIAAARMLMRFGHQAVVFERSASLGGVWAVTYPEVRLQNIAEHYRLSDFPWPFAPDLHPSREQILRYMQAVVDQHHIELRLGHEVLTLREEGDGWEVELRSPSGPSRERFDQVVVASGQYTGQARQPALEGRERFPGQVLADREVRDLAVLGGKRVAVVGFGKTAVDMACFAAERGSQVHHVFREPRWMLPRSIRGIHYSKVLLSRMSTAFIPAWVQPSAAERLLHTRLQPLVRGYWALVERAVLQECGLSGGWRAPEVRRRMELLRPESPLTFEMRSSIALAPEAYYPYVAQGRIEPHRGEPVGFSEHGLRLKDGRELPCDLVLLATGFQPPRFPYLPERYRGLLESEPDGPQLYRHLLHPHIPRLAFAGFNHAFLHIPGVELGMLWLGAWLRGDLVLPPVEEMERCIAQVRQWKREHSLFEGTRGCAINTRFHQYFDVMLGDLGLRPYRKSNPLAELVEGYSAGDYSGLFEEYERTRATLERPRRPLPLAT